MPAASAFTGDDNLSVGSWLRGNVPIGERQSTKKAIHYGIVEFASHDSWPVHCQPDLLLVMPVLREFPRRVKPVGRFFFAGPAYTVRSRRIRIAGSVELRQ